MKSIQVKTFATVLIVFILLQTNPSYSQFFEDSRTGLLWFNDVQALNSSLSSGTSRSEWLNGFSLPSQVDINGDEILDDLSWQWATWDEVQYMVEEQFRPLSMWQNLSENQSHFYKLAGTDGPDMFSYSMPVNWVGLSMGYNNLSSDGIVYDEDLSSVGYRVVPMLNATYELGTVSTPEPNESEIYGLFVGVDDEKFGPLNLGLDGSQNANDLRNAFSGAFLNSDIDNLIVQPVDKTTGYSAQQLQDDIELLTANMDDNDIFVLYINAHGGPTGFDGGEATFNNDDEHLNLGDNYNPDDGFNDSKLLDDELTTVLQNFEDIEKWVLLDGCYSGGFWGDENLAELVGSDLYTIDNTSFLASAPEDRTGTYNGFTGETSFNKALIEALSSGSGNLYTNADINKDGTLDFDEIVAYVQNWIATDWFTNPDDKVVFGYTGLPTLENEPAFELNLEEWESGYNPVSYTNSTRSYSLSTGPVPEPTTMLLFGLGLLGLAGVDRKKK